MAAATEGRRPPGRPRGIASAAVQMLARQSIHLGRGGDAELTTDDMKDGNPRFGHEPRLSPMTRLITGHRWCHPSRDSSVTYVVNSHTLSSTRLTRQYVSFEVRFGSSNTALTTVLTTVCLAHQYDAFELGPTPNKLPIESNASRWTASITST